MSPEEHNRAFARVRGLVLSVAGHTGPGTLDDGRHTTIVLSDQTRVSAAYWRLSQDRRPLVTSIEHGQHRGAPPINSIEELRAAILGQECQDVQLDMGSGDLLIAFAGAICLQAFRLRSLYEDWEVSLPNGETYWSNMVDFHSRSSAPDPMER